jgi:hypothetical protein
MPRLRGYAIVSGNGAIADSGGRMPESLKFDADFERFQSALDASDLTLIGHATHRAAPNFRHRHRLIMSRTARADDRDARHYWWDPARQSLDERIASLPVAVQTVAVVGGTALFDMMLVDPGYELFELTIAERVVLAGGTPVFHGVESAGEAIDRLTSSGLVIQTDRLLDGDRQLRVVTFRRDGGERAG